MDEVIFEEFKGTGNMELKLDRTLQERRIFPAIDILKSGTRREEALLSDDEMEASWILRRQFDKLTAAEAMQSVLNLMKNSDNNKEFVDVVLKNFSKK